MIVLTSSPTAKTMPIFSERLELFCPSTKQTIHKVLLLSTTSNFLDDFQEKQKDFRMPVKIGGLSFLQLSLTQLVFL